MNLSSLKPASAYAVNLGGIYCIFNRTNGKAYIGSAINIKNRLHNHKKYLTGNRHPNMHLQAAWNSCAIDFDFLVIEIIVDATKLLEREQHWIDLYKTTDNKKGYNRRLKVNSNLGIKFSAETRAKISASNMGQSRNKGRKLTAEHKLKVSVALKGRKHSKEHIEKRIAYKRGKPISAEQKLKISNTLRGNKYREKKFVPISTPMVIS